MPLPRSILDAPFDPLPNAKCPSGSSASQEAITEAQQIVRAWEALKRQIAVRDKYRCRLCGKACRYTDPLPTKADPHHIIFASAQGPDASYNLLYMCRGCHDLVHKVRRFWLTGNADDKDEMGRGMVKVERQTESGFECVGFI